MTRINNLDLPSRKRYKLKLKRQHAVNDRGGSDIACACLRCKRLTLLNTDVDKYINIGDIQRKPKKYCRQKFLRRHSVGAMSVEKTLLSEESVKKLPKSYKFRTVFVGAPSCTGKSTILNYIKSHYECSDVSNISYDALWSRTHDDSIISDIMANQRNDSKIYEHTYECSALYRIIHEYMKNQHLLNLFRNADRATVDLFYNRCVSTLRCADNISNIVRFVLLDVTPAYKQRYYERLNNTYNGIDYRDDAYLYLQILAFLAFIENIEMFPRMTVIIAIDDNDDDDRPSEMFGEEDRYGIKRRIRTVLDNFRLYGNVRIDDRRCSTNGIEPGGCSIMLTNKFSPSRVADMIIAEHISDFSEDVN